jgi:hypothetical protein
MPPALDINVGSPVLSMPTAAQFAWVILSSPIAGQIVATPPITAAVDIERIPIF